MHQPSNSRPFQVAIIRTIRQIMGEIGATETHHEMSLIYMDGPAPRIYFNEPFYTDWLRRNTLPFLPEEDPLCCQLPPDPLERPFVRNPAAIFAGDVRATVKYCKWRRYRQIFVATTDAALAFSDSVGQHLAAVYGSQAPSKLLKTIRCVPFTARALGIVMSRQGR